MKVCRESSESLLVCPCVCLAVRSPEGVWKTTDKAKMRAGSVFLLLLLSQAAGFQVSRSLLGC